MGILFLKKCTIVVLMREKKLWEIVRKSDIGSRMYFLLLLYPLRLKDLAVVLFDNENKKRMLNCYRKKMEELGYVTFKGVQVKIFKKGKFYRANLKLLFDFWRDFFEINKRTMKKEIRKKSFQKIFQIFNIDEIKIEENKEIKEILELLKKVRFLDKDEKEILQKVWNNNIEIIRKSFERNVLPYIRMPLIEWDALELLTDFWMKLLESVLYYRKVEKIREDVNIGKLKYKDGREMTEDEKRYLIKSSDELLTNNTIEVTKMISNERLEEIIMFLDVILKYKQRISIFYDED
jgi:hypothetical protein